MRLVVVASLTAGFVLGAGPAVATEQGPTAASGTTVTETMPSGLGVQTVYAETDGGLTVDDDGTMAGKQGGNELFTPDLDLDQTATNLVVYSDDSRGGSNCTVPNQNTTNICSDRGRMTVNFSRPVTNPVLNVTGLGGNVGGRVYFTAVLRNLTPGASFGPVLSGTNLTSTGTTIEAPEARANAICTSAVRNGGTAGCGSVEVPGTWTSLTFQIDLKLRCVSSSSACQSSFDNTDGADQIFTTWTTHQDFGDAPASYQGSTAPQHTVGDLKLGATIDADDADTDGPNTSISPYAVASGSSANSPRGDGADEDAFGSGLPNVVAGAPYVLTVPISGASRSGTVAGWVDFNGNGTFDSGERTSATFAAGATTAVLTWSPLATATAVTGSTYARVRAAYDASDVASPSGRAASGEVEDYSVTVSAELPFIEMTKAAGTVQDTNGDGIVSAGDRLPYTFTVRNTGNVTLTDVGVTDPKIADISCPVSTLAAGATTTCTGTYTLNQVDLTLGSVDNTATARGTSPAGTPVLGPAQATKTLPQTPRIGLVKSAGALNDANGNDRADVGETIAYSFAVTNTGTVPLTSVSVTDPKTTTVSCPDDTLAPGASTTCTATHALTQAEIDAGEVTNTASASGTPPNGDPVTAQSSASKDLDRAPALTVTKSVTPGFPQDTNADGLTDVGDTIRWTFAVENTGNTTLTDVTINDPKAGSVSCAMTVLAPGGTTTCTSGDYVVVAGDAPTLTNTATASGEDPQGGAVTSARATTSTPLQTPNPALTFDKQAAAPVDANGSGLTDAGDTIAYTFLVTNSGNVPMTALQINDPKIGAVSCSETDLAVGASTTCSATYTIVTSDQTSGAVDNTATASATAPSGDSTTSNADSTSTPVETPNPSLQITKTAGAPVDVNNDGITDAGDTITYSFSITNTGDVPISTVAVNDPKLAPTVVTCTPTTLAPGATTNSCTSVTYTITTTDEAAGEVTNTATATGTATSGATITSPPSAVTTPVTKPAPALLLVKTAGTPVDEDSSGDVNPGDTVDYTFTITNTGNVPLTDVNLDDPKIGPVTNCSPTTLQPGQDASCSKSYTITAQDQTDGSVVNNATASGTSPAGRTATSPVAQTSTPVDAPNPSLVLDKQAGTPVDVNANGITDAGDRIPYTFVVTNNGNAPITGLSINDTQLDVPAVCVLTVLAVGEDTTCSGVHTVTAAEQTAGTSTNTATASGDAGGAPVTSPSDTTATPIVTPAPKLVLDKQAATPIDTNGDGLVDAGDSITYSFVVTNVGNTTINTLTVSDPKVGPVSCSVTTLGAGAATTCTAAPYTITPADQAAGSVDNRATASGTSGSGEDPAGTTVTSAPDATSTPTRTPAPSLTLDKVAGDPVDVNNDGLTDAGDTIAYTFTIKNTGNVPLITVGVTDTKVGAVTCAATTLAVGATTTCEPAVTPYVITPADVSSGAVANTATASGTSPTNQTATATDSTSTPTRTPAPGLTVQKSVSSYTDTNSDGLVDASDTIVYRFAVRNTGNIPMSLIGVTDPKLAGAAPPASIDCPVATVAPGASVTCTSTPYTITAADVAAGSVDNTATPTGTRSDNGLPFTGTPGTNSYPTTTPAPAISVDKQAATPVDVNNDGLTDEGDTIAYTFVVVNGGNVPLTNVQVIDPQVGAVSCDGAPVTLTPGASVTCSATYTVQAGDEAAGAVNNLATASGAPASGGPDVSATDTTSTPVVASNASLSLTKSAGAPTDVNGNELTDAGDTIRYRFAVRNTGNVPVADLTIVDAKITGAITCPVETLAPGAGTTCVAVYTITEDDEALGTVTNSATAEGTDPDDDPVVSLASQTVTPTTGAEPALTIDKQAADPIDVNSSGLVDAGDTIAYSFVVENTGNVLLADVSVDDDTVDPVTCLADRLAPGETTSCSAAPYVITEADEAAGAVQNIAFASGIDPEDADVTSGTDSTSTGVQTPAPRLEIDKQVGAPNDVNGDGLTDAGDTLDYTFVVTNTGNVPLTSLQITDSVAGPVTCDTTALAVGGSTACAANAPYEITTTDQTSGAVQNTAFATAADPDGGAVQSNDDSTSTSVRTPAPRLTIDKTADEPVDVNADGITDAGDRIQFRFTVTNTGDVPLTAVSIVDPLAGATTCEDTDLAVGGSTTCEANAPYTISTADQSTGAVNNTARARATDAQGTQVTSAPDSTSTPVETPAPVLELKKTAGQPVDVNNNGIPDAGDSIMYTFKVTNAGNVPIIQVAISDAKVGSVTCVSRTLAPGASTTCSANAVYTVTPNDSVAGQVSNSATATGTGPGATAVRSGPSTTSTPVQRALPKLAIDKVAGTPLDVNDDGLTGIGDKIPYTFTVTNTGNVPLSSISVSDAKVGPVSCDAATLAPGASTECTADAPYEVTEVDLPPGVDKGTVQNTATATGVDSGGVTTRSDTDSTSTPITAKSPAMTMDKTAADPVDVNGDGITDHGDTIEYTFVVTNTGNVPIVVDPAQQYGIVDDLVTIDPADCDVTELDASSRIPVDGSLTCTAVYTVTTDDESAGQAVNIAHGEASDPDGDPVRTPDDSTTTKPVDVPNPELTLTKTAGTPVDVNDDGVISAGDQVSYTFSLENTGNVPVHEISIDDPMLGAITCTPAVDGAGLAAGALTSCTAAPYTIQDDDPSPLVNQATATGTDDYDEDVTSNTATATVALGDPQPRLSLSKKAGVPVDVNDDGIVDAGDTIQFTFTLTNSGNVPVDAVSVTDPMVGSVSCDAVDLAVGDSTDCRADAVYTITAADVTDGSVDNSARAEGTDRYGQTTGSNPATTSTAVQAPTPRLSLVKTASAPVDLNESGLTDAGDTIQYTFTVTNTGNVPVDAIAVSDPLAGQVTCGDGTLAPGQSTDCAATSTYVITTDDETAGSVENTATATGTDRDGGPVTSPEDSTTTAVQTPDPTLSLVKRAGTPVDVNSSGLTDAGDTIQFTFTVTNTGNVPATAIEVADPIAGAVTCDTRTLAPDASTECAADQVYTVTAIDQGTGEVRNTASANGLDPDGDPVMSETDNTVSPVSTPQPSLVLQKVAAAPIDVNDDGLTDAGDTITFSFTLTNNGNVPLRAVEVIDPLVGDVTCQAVMLAPNQSVSCAADEVYTITGDDETAGEVVNEARARGVDPDDNTVRSNIAQTNTPVDVPDPALTLDKVAGTPVDVNNDGLVDAGDTIQFTFTLTNSGNVPLNDVNVSDPKVGGVRCSQRTLEPLESITCAAATPYVITAADVTTGSVDNTASASAATNDDDEVLSNLARTSTGTTTPRPALTMDKRAAAPTDVNSSGITDAGDTIEFSFVVTNTGNVPVSGLNIVDPTVGAVTCPVDALAPGATTTCATADPYVVTEADEANGSVDNTARARATHPDGGVVSSATDSTTTPVVSPAPRLTVDKRAAAPVDVNNDGLADAGDTIVYTFVVTNTGNVPISNLDIEDSLLDDASPAVTISCDSTTLAPSATTTCTATPYTISATNAATGQVANTASATGDDPDGALVSSASDSTTTPVERSLPELTIDKRAGTPVDVNSSGITDAGDTITYRFDVTNTGNVPVSGVAVADTFLAAQSPEITVTCLATTLAPNERTTCVADDPYVITTNDTTVGRVSNVARATATDPDGGDVTSDPDSTSTPVVAKAPALTVDKIAADPVDVNADGLTDRGDTIEYRFVVSNTGNVPLTDITIDDDRLENISCDAAPLAPGATVTCTADAYTITSDDEAAGRVVNVATASATDPDDESVTSPEDSSTTSPVDTPVTALVLDKRVSAPTDTNRDGLTDAGDTLRFTFVVTNRSNVPLTSVEVDDDMVGTVTCPTTTLAPGEQVTCTADAYTIDGVDAASGSVDNVASATGEDGYGDTVTSNSDATSTPTTSPAPSLSLTKQAGDPVDVNRDGLVDRGDTVEYTYVVTNDGNVPIDEITVSDDRIDDVVCDRMTVAVGQTTTCTASYTILEADHGTTVTNVAIAAGSDRDGDPVESLEATADVLVGTPAPALAIDKSAAAPVDVDGNEIVNAGDTIAYSFVVENIGNVPLTQVTVDDPSVGAVTCDPSTLPVGGSTSCTTAPHTITQEEVDAGAAQNTAAGIGTDGYGATITSASDSTSTSIEAVPRLKLVKVDDLVDASGNGTADRGETVNYTFTVTNTGNVPVTGIAVDDPKVGAVTCVDAELAPKGSTTCIPDTAYTVTQTDMDAGAVLNSAATTGVAPDSSAVRSAAATASTPVTVDPSLTVVKTAQLDDRDGDDKADPGESIGYSFLVTNTGNVTLTDVTVRDSKLDEAGDTVSCTTTTLAPDESMACTATYEVTESDVRDGSVQNTASASAAQGGAAITSPDSSADIAAERPTGISGLLPDTGGPTVTLMLLAGLLVLGGAAFVAAGRRPRAGQHR